MHTNTAFSVDIGEELNKEFIHYWNDKKDKTLPEINLTPQRGKRKKGTLSLTIPENVLITIATTAGTTIIAEIVKTFWKEFVEFIKKKKTENQKIPPVVIIISNETKIVPPEQIDTLLTDENYIPKNDNTLS